jgi:hypothetical protein
MPNIMELMALKPVIQKNFSKALPLESPNPHLLMGVEFEIENVVRVDDATDACVPGIKATTDGSLRNRGYEFITSPMTYSNLVYTIDLFYHKNGWNADNFSERCSTHVHVNCQNLTLEVVANMCLLYQTFEKLLYNFADPERYNNIFCVPWRQTLLPNKLVTSLREGKTDIIAGWQKYTGLNLNPLRTQGTVEFRHFPGCMNKDKFYEWLKIISHLFAYAEKNEYNVLSNIILNLNTTSAYDNFLVSVFREQARQLQDIQDYKSLMADGVLSSKFMLEYKTTVKPVKENLFPDNFYTGVGLHEITEWLEVHGYHDLAQLGYKVEPTGRIVIDTRGRRSAELVIVQIPQAWAFDEEVAFAPEHDAVADDIVQIRQQHGAVLQNAGQNAQMVNNAVPARPANFPWQAQPMVFFDEQMQQNAEAPRHVNIARNR